MITALFLIVAVLAIGQFLLFGALAEAYRDIRQLREFVGAVDESFPVDLGEARDAVPSRYGLRVDLDSAARAVVVFLDSHCGTCRQIAGSLGGAIPDGMWLVTVAESAGAAYEWLADQAGIEAGSAAMTRVMATTPDEVERNFGLRITPLAIEIEDGRMTRAKTVPSVRRFYALAPTMLTLEKPITEGVSS